MKKINFGSNEEFIKNYEKLKSSRKMAELYNCSKGAVLNHAKAIGYCTSNNQIRKIADAPIEEIIKLYEELKSATKVGELFNCSSTAVLNYLKSNGYTPINSNSKLSNILDKDFISAYIELKSAKKMGEKFGCSSTAILNHAKKIGFNVNNTNRNYKLTQNDKNYIIQMYNIKSSNQLAEEFQVSRGIITKVWFDANLLNKKTKNTKTTEIDITGQRFGKWTVLYKTDKRNAGGVIYWHCRCECGIERDVLGTTLRAGTSLSCGNHKMSKGNEKITQILIKNDIPFETEKKFSTCKDKKELPFDFYVNNSYLIEYDGEQHYDEQTIFDYEYTHSHDLIKSQWCKENNIPLIRIPYTHFNELKLEDLLLETSNFVE